MALDLGPLKAVVQDLINAAEHVGVDVANQEAGIAQEDLDGLTSALQGVHSKLTGAGATPAAGSVPADPAAAGAGGAPEGAGSAGSSAAWTPPQG